MLLRGQMPPGYCARAGRVASSLPEQAVGPWGSQGLETLAASADPRDRITATHRLFSCPESCPKIEDINF